MPVLFIVRKGFKLVGCDAEGLELRMLGHYLHRYDQGAFTYSVVNGDKAKGTDARTINMKIVRLNTRDAAKTFIYALIYGAGNMKLGTVVYDDYTDAQRERFHAKYPVGDAHDEALKRVGSLARRRIMEGLPALAKLTEMVKGKAKRGYILGLDRRHLIIRSLNASLNTLLQSGGAIVMKAPWSSPTTSTWPSAGSGAPTSPSASTSTTRCRWRCRKRSPKKRAACSRTRSVKLESSTTSTAPSLVTMASATTGARPTRSLSVPQSLPRPVPWIALSSQLECWWRRGPGRSRPVSHSTSRSGTS